MASKSTNKTVSIVELKVDTKTNVRLATNYDVPAMKQAILDVGRITDPIHVRAEDMVVLRGNRRTLAGQELLADPSTPQEVAASLKKVAVVMHDVKPGSSEELAVILDHGSQKRLSRTEVLLAVWRLDKQFMSEGQIIGLLYSALAVYTGNTKKETEAAGIANLKDRSDYLRKWLHGTVGNYMLAGNKMGEYVREQMVKTHLSEDKLLPTGDKVECRMSRDRITQLSAAKSKDDPKNGGEGWSPDQGGRHFNELLEKFKAEDRGEQEAEGSKRPSAKALRERADAFNSPGIKAALMLAAGDTEQGRALVDIDDLSYRLHLAAEVLAKRLSGITNPEVKHLIDAILGNHRLPVGEIEIALNKFSEPK